MTDNHLGPDFIMDDFAPINTGPRLPLETVSEFTGTSNLLNTPLFPTVKKKGILKPSNHVTHRHAASLMPGPTGNLLQEVHSSSCRNCLKPLNHLKKLSEFNISYSSLENLSFEQKPTDDKSDESAAKPRKLFCTAECEIACLQDEIKQARKLILSNTKNGNGSAKFSADVATVHRTILQPRWRRIRELSSQLASASSSANVDNSDSSGKKTVATSENNSNNTSLSFASQTRPVNIKTLERSDESSVASSVSSSFYVGSFRENVKKNNKLLAKILNYNFA